MDTGVKGGWRCRASRSPAAYKIANRRSRMPTKSFAKCLAFVILNLRDESRIALRHQLTVLGNGSLQKAVGKYDQQSITLENTMGAAGLLLSVVESESCWSNSTYWDGNQHELPGTTKPPKSVGRIPGVSTSWSSKESQKGRVFPGLWCLWKMRSPAPSPYNSTLMNRFPSVPHWHLGCMDLDRPWAAKDVFLDWTIVYPVEDKGPQLGSGHQGPKSSMLSSFSSL